MKKLLKSTTTLGMCLALALPTGAFAQTTDVACAVEGEEATFPCVLADGTEVQDAEQLMEIEAAEAQQAAEAEAAEQAAAAAAAEEQSAAAEAEAAEKAAADAAAAEEAAADAAAAEEAAAAEQAAQEAAAAEQAAAAEAQAAEDAAAAEAKLAEEAAAAEAKAAEAQAAEAQAVEAQAAETSAEPAAEPAIAEASDAETQAPEQSERPAAPAATAEAEAQPAQSSEPEAAQTAEAPSEEQIAAELAERQAAEAAVEEQRAADAAAAAASAAAADSGQAEAEVVTEEITEEETRASDQEFATSVTGQNATAATAEEDKGLSKFEKALLLGLGAVAVGAVLKNGSKVVSNSGDRLIVEDQTGNLRVLKDDDALIRQAGDEVRRETFNDGSARTTVIKPDGSQIVTILGRDGTVLRRLNIDPQGNEYVLFDDTVQEQRIVVNELPQVEQTNTLASQTDEEALRAALITQLRGENAQRFSLRQVRDIQQVRALAPQVELDAVRFATGSAAIQPEQARALASIGATLTDAIRQDPRTVILVEGHTDAVGDAGYNLALSDRRAETVALALTEYFNVPPANLITQGYGEAALKVPTDQAEPANRRAVVRNITGLLRN